MYAVGVMVMHAIGVGGWRWDLGLAAHQIHKLEKVDLGIAAVVGDVDQSLGQACEWWAIGMRTRGGLFVV